MGKRTPPVVPYRDEHTSFGHGLDLRPLKFKGKVDGKEKTYTFYGETSEEAAKYAKAWARKHKVKLERVDEA